MSVNVKTEDGLLMVAGKPYSDDVVSPQMYGAVADGETDVSDIVQSMIDNGVENIFFPTGTYKFSKPVVIKSTLKNIYGRGNKSSIIKGSGDKIFTDGGNRLFNLKIKSLGFVGNNANTAIKGGFAYSSFEDLDFHKFNVCCDFDYGTWIFSCRDSFFYNSEYGVKCADESNAIIFDNISMEDVSEVCFDIEGARSFSISNSRIERCNICVATSTTHGLNIESSYFESVNLAIKIYGAYYWTDILFYNNYFLYSSEHENGYLCNIDLMKTDNVQGGKLIIENNNFVPSGTAAERDIKPFKFIAQSSEYKYCNLAITFKGNYYRENEHKYFVDLFDRTAYTGVFSTQSRVLFDTDYEIANVSDETTGLEARAIPTIYHNQTKAQKYHITGVISYAVTGYASLNFNLANVLRPYVTADLTATCIYDDNSVGLVRIAISDKLYFYGIDTTKKTKKFILDLEYTFK